MRLFNHVTDFGPKGMQNVYPMAAVAERVVLWGPSASYINKARADGHSPFTPSDILKLVEAEVITIMCRDWWLDEKERLNLFKKRKQSFYKWDPDFDGAIWELAEKSAGQNDRQKFVIKQGKEPGEDYVKAVFEDPKIENHSRDLKNAKLLLRKEKFGLTLKKKLDAASSKEERLRIILRDMINHREAYENSGAEWAIIESENSRLYSKAIMSPVRITTPTDLDIEQIIPLMKIISHLNKDLRRENLLEILMNPELAKAKRDAEKFLRPGVNLSYKLRQDIEKNTPRFRDVLKRDGIFGGISSVAGHLLNLASTQVQINPYWNFAPAALPFARGVLEFTNVAPLSYKGETFPFIMTIGTKHPKLKELQEASQILKRLERDEGTIT